VRIFAAHDFDKSSGADLTATIPDSVRSFDEKASRHDIRLS
jgi:hypothetical protein